MNTPCSTGRYCPAGTSSEDQYLCPAGTYYDSTGAQTVDDCIQCTAGFYCATPGLASPTAQCAAGKSNVYTMGWIDRYIMGYILYLTLNLEPPSELVEITIVLIIVLELMKHDQIEA